MKAIINGFRFDTEKAIRIGSAYRDGYMSDSSYWSATLYVTPRARRYFFVGSGGPMTIFGRASRKGKTCGETRIYPLSKEVALAWAKRNLPAEEVKAGFPDTVQDA